MAEHSKSTRKRVTLLQAASRKKKAPSLAARCKLLTEQHGAVLQLQRETLSQLAAVLERTSALEQRSADEDARAAAFVDRFNREHRSLLDRAGNRLAESSASAVNGAVTLCTSDLNPLQAGACTEPKALFHLTENETDTRVDAVPPLSPIKRFSKWVRSL